MSSRMNPYSVAPKAMQAMIDLAERLREDALEPSLMELVKIRVSQINGCAFCLHMHTSDARKQGEAEERIHLLPAWRESGMFTPRERAALAWTEALTLITQGHAPDEVYAEVAAHFEPVEIVRLTLEITTINAWNRIAIGFRSVHPHERALAR
ncbi:carboxymuconolactone decarboxylase family protein [Geminicoccus roseus]|uniref:carboxymuconolactone decarboxylase family protein n=1 Tax=Geminicoccus roseus TaxID=404900 RepID=UPI0004232D85|nr:carboxymuconolactone decarboxylase family protein [Geminicoccus roseus]